MESIKSVQDNPFFKHFGIKHAAPTLLRNNHRRTQQEKENRQSFNGPSSAGGDGTDEDDDEIGEYRPVSGFVHKLLDKFSSLSAKEERVPHHLKRSSSVDELAADTVILRNKPQASKDGHVSSTFDKNSYSPLARLSNKAKSIESLNNIHKPHQYNSYGVSLRHADKQLDRKKQPTSPVSPKLQCDVEIGGDNIIIIENTSSVILSSEVSVRNRESTVKIVSAHEVVLSDEMPKPNTVLTVRNIFESASRRQKSDAPLSPLSPSTKSGLSPLQTEIVAFSQDMLSRRGSTQSPSPVTSPRYGHENYSKPVLLPSASIYTKSGDHSRLPSDSLSEDLKSLDNTSSGFEGNNHSDISSFQNSISQLHNTPNVGTTLHYKQGTASIPLSPNATAPSSTTYPRSRPVVTVAPYKDRPEEKDDGQPVMIYSKSKMSHREEKSQNIHNNTEKYNVPDELEETKQLKDIVLPKEAKKIFEEVTSSKPHLETQNKSLRRENVMNDLNTKNRETTISNKNVIVKTQRGTSIQIGNTQKVDVAKDPVSVRSDIPNKDSDLSSVKLIDEPSSAPKKLKGRAPAPPEQPESINNRTASLAPNSLINKEDSSQNSVCLTDSNKQLDQTEAVTRNGDPPLKKALKDQLQSEDQPIKGIPSIIAQRLRQQNANPSHIASDVVSTADISVSSPVTESNNLYSRALLTPSGSNNVKASLEKAEKDIVSSEIENEIAAVRRKMEANRARAEGPAQIFDSSQLVKKKKKSKQSDGLVPPLELSSITDDEIMNYQPQMKKIKPCNIVFIGENAKTSRSLLDKKRKIKINIHFDDLKTETFEYPSEEVALERYLEEHPHEKEEILVLEEFGGMNGDSESSDDVEIDIYVTPAASTTDSLLKSNTGLAHTGNLQSYRGRFQQDYEFGAILNEEPVALVIEVEAEVDPEKLMLRPAEDDNSTWSSTETSDILF